MSRIKARREGRGGGGGGNWGLSGKELMFSIIQVKSFRIKRGRGWTPVSFPSDLPLAVNSHRTTRN